MKTILAPVDFSDAMQLVAEKAAEMAHALGANLHFVHIVEPTIDPISYYTDASFLGPLTDFESLDKELERETKIMDALVNRYEAQGLNVTSEIHPGIPGRDILTICEKMEPEMVVVGSHGHGALYHLILGGVSESVIHQAKCPVLVVHSPGRTKTRQTILAESGAKADPTPASSPGIA